MASKRSATSDLNHTNWNQDEDPEESGSFSKAAEDVIKNRVIKVAKRRNPIGTLATSEGEKKSVFASFGGFSKAPLSTAATSSPFSFLSSVVPNKPEEQPKTNGLSDTSSIIKTSSAASSTPTFKLPESKSIVSPFVTSNTQNSKKSKDYYAKLKGLNQSVSKWIKKHVDTNPFLNLTPIFRDYEKYLEEIENLPKDDEKESPFTHKVTDVKTVTSTTKVETQKEMSTFTFKPTQDKPGNKKSLTGQTNTNTISTKLLEAEDDGKDTKSPSFAFGATSSSPTFSFGKPIVQPSTSAAGFSFGGDASKPFTFSNVAKPVEQEASKDENEEAEDEPPKVEFTPVVEEGHVYTIRCKVFIKKGDKFGDRGVGNMYLKPVPNSDKIQLIVRADTSLGNLLCNFILSKNIPMQRLGKKDVMVVCLPTHDSEPPPVPVLFRVKSPEEADELLKTLEKHKK